MKTLFGDAKPPEPESKERSPHALPDPLSIVGLRRFNSDPSQFSLHQNSAPSPISPGPASSPTALRRLEFDRMHAVQQEFSSKLERNEKAFSSGSPIQSSVKNLSALSPSSMPSYPYNSDKKFKAAKKSHFCRKILSSIRVN